MLSGFLSITVNMLMSVDATTLEVEQTPTVHTNHVPSR